MYWAWLAIWKICSGGKLFGFEFLQFFIRITAGHKPIEKNQGCNHMVCSKVIAVHKKQQNVVSVQGRAQVKSQSSLGSSTGSIYAFCIVFRMFDLPTNCIYRDFRWVEQQWALRSLASLSMDGVFCNLSVFGWFSLGLLSGVALHNLRGDAFLGFEI